MDNLLVAVFDTESAAFEGLKALEDLHWSGDITLYGSAVIAKDSTGAVEWKQEPSTDEPATIFGMVAGGLLGLLAGPAGAAAGATAAAASSAALAGSYAGAVAGAMGGAVIDLSRYDFSLDFIDEVSTYLVPGKYAVLAEVDETWLVVVDTRLVQLGGVVFRRPASEVSEDQLAHEAAEIDAEMAELDAELAQADAETAAALDRQIERTRQRAKALQARVTESLDRLKTETNAKIKTLQDQMKHANEQRKAQIEHRIAEVKTDSERRRQKLEQARPLIKEALAPHSDGRELGETRR